VAVNGRRASPTLRRKRLGQELRRLREEAKVTIEQVAVRMECSTSKVSRIETGHTGVAPRDVRTMLDIYGVDGDQADELVQVAREARQKGWWQLYGTVLTGHYVGLEQAADRIRAYESQAVPGLLQTEDYARAMIRAGRPDIPTAECEKRVRVRMFRQSLLTQDDPLDLWVVLDEAALRRPVGGHEVMRKQFEKLVQASELPNVTLQILPFDVGAHAGLDGTFAILQYDEPNDPMLVFAAHAAGGLFLEKDDELQRYAYIFDRLRASALSAEASVDMFAALAKER